MNFENLQKHRKPDVKRHRQLWDRNRVAPSRSRYNLDSRPVDLLPAAVERKRDNIHNPSPCCGRPGQIVFVGRSFTEFRCSCGKTYDRH